MRRFQFELAEPQDDADLRHVLAATPMEGAISIAFAREPSYFAAAEVDGDVVQVGVVRDRNTGRVIGMGSRAISNHFVNGRQRPVGYLSGLRLLPEYRGRGGLLARGYAFLRELHRDGRAPYYLTTITEDNAPALRLLASQRAGLPVYHYLGRYATLVLKRSTARHPKADPPIQVRAAKASDRDRIVTFLMRHGIRRQFFPALRAGDLFTDHGRLRRLDPCDTLLAFRGDALVGTLGFWNQSAFKQTMVTGYQPWLRAVRPVYNGWARCRRLPRLPAPGERVRSVYGAIPVVRDDDPDVLRRLLASSPPPHRGAENDAILLGLFETDPLLPVARRYAVRRYVTRLYVVYWKEHAPDMNELICRVPYLELGCL